MLPQAQQCRALRAWVTDGTQQLCFFYPVITSNIVPGRRFHLFEHCGGSVTLFAERVSSGGLPYVLDFLPWPSVRALQYILAFGAVQALLQSFLPGKTFHGPVTPMGNTPVYKVGALCAPSYWCYWYIAAMPPVPSSPGRPTHNCCTPFASLPWDTLPWTHKSCFLVRCHLLRTGLTIP